MGVHLSRLGEELVLWSTTEFGFVRLGEGYCSGSSLMPQKRNPDIAELLRGKPARAIGDVVALLTISKGLTLAYNKDLQETQEPLYDAIETARLALARVARADRRRWSSTSRACARPPTIRRWARPISPRTWCAAACRSAARTRSWGALVRARRGEEGVAARAVGGRSAQPSTPALTPTILQALDPARAVAARVADRRPGARRGRARGRAPRGRAARRSASNRSASKRCRSRFTLPATCLASSGRGG